MQELFQNFQIRVNDKLYIKDPESSELGKRIVENSILLMDEIGFESFTFKKLSDKINSTEASVYRYFENKHKLLIYLTSWYWAWIDYQVVLHTYSISNAEKKLETIISIVSQTIQADDSFTHIDEGRLFNIMINEYSKSFLTKEVDDDNKDGFFAIYKRVITRLKEAILAVRPEYPFPASLASTVVESALHQHFLKKHFHTITDCNESVEPSEFCKNLVLQTLNVTSQ
uniref:TetR/AcrR family transcriptional regulator n=1 Tax=Subsaxibacter sp. CAU 1640 TaxID=2933271 RepID=UPI002005BA85|nr:TetR/AcrR family transcriptional regulator [Subsaxibacter sp. CAU 1640]MCK7590657.1 TetR/AcrR family transcriptional regulator [Subsaxibacter sp. CAU 1640]